MRKTRKHIPKKKRYTKRINKKLNKFTNKRRHKHNKKRTKRLKRGGRWWNRNIEKDGIEWYNIIDTFENNIDDINISTYYNVLFFIILSIFNKPNQPDTERWSKLINILDTNFEHKEKLKDERFTNEELKKFNFEVKTFVKYMQAQLANTSNTTWTNKTNIERYDLDNQNILVQLHNFNTKPDIRLYQNQDHPRLHKTKIEFIFHELKFDNISNIKSVIEDINYIAAEKAAAEAAAAATRIQAVGRGRLARSVAAEAAEKAAEKKKYNLPSQPDAVLSPSPDAVLSPSPDAVLSPSPDAVLSPSPDAVLSPSPDAVLSPSASPRKTPPTPTSIISQPT